MDVERRLLSETKFLASLVPKLVAVCGDFGGHNAVEDDDAIICKDAEHLCHDFLQPPAMSANEDGIRMGNAFYIYIEEIAHMDVDAWGSKFAGVFMDDGFTLWPYLEGLDMQMRELQAGLDADAARTETDIPKHISLR